MIGENDKSASVENLQENAIALSPQTEFYPIKALLKIRGETFRIFPNESVALHQLITREGETITYDELKRIMGTKSKSPANERVAVQVRINTLVLLFDKDPDLVGSIENVWGKGYRFSPRLKIR